MRPADPRFQHPTAPHREFLRLAHVVDLLCFGEPPYSPDFDIDNSASATLDGKRCTTRMNDRLVKADCSAQLSLQAGVVINFVVPNWVLYHDQILPVALNQILDPIKRLIPDHITTQHHILPASTNLL